MGGKKWNDLKDSLRNVLGEISASSQEHIVSIINFSGTANCEFKRQNPNTINIPGLSFMGDGTNFGVAFKEAINLLENDNSKHNIRMIFMTDGNSSYPQDEIYILKTLISRPAFYQKKNFKFYGLGFQCSSPEFDRIVKEFGGEMKFAKDGEELKMKYMEIFTRSLG